MKNRPVGTKMFHAGGRTDRHDEANNPFSQFCERAQKSIFCETQCFIAMFTLACHVIPFCSNWNQPESSTNVQIQRHHIYVTAAVNSFRIFQTKRRISPPPPPPAQHCNRSWTTLVYTTVSHPISLRIILILSSNLCLGIPISLPLTFCDQNIPCSHRMSTCMLHATCVLHVPSSNTWRRGQILKFCHSPIFIVRTEWL
jgi:hypothetical protein